MIRILMVSLVAVVGTRGIVKAGMAWKRGEVGASHFWSVLLSIAASLALILSL